MVNRSNQTAACCVALIAALGLACTEAQDQYSRVRDLRILAMRADPPDLIDSPLPGAVRFDALVVDPRSDDPIEYQWRVCPVESGRACFDYDTLLENANSGLAPLLEGLTGITSGIGGGSIPGCTLSADATTGIQRFATLLVDLADPAYMTQAYYDRVIETETFDIGGNDVPMREVDLSPLADAFAELSACAGGPPITPALPSQISDLHLFHLLTNPITSLLGVWPSAVLTVSDGVEELTAQKRFTVHWRDPGSPLNLVNAFLPGVDFGLQLCPPGLTPRDVPECLLMRRRTANTNPVFADVFLSEGDSAFTRFSSLRRDPSLPDDLQFDPTVFTLPPGVSAEERELQPLPREVFAAMRRDSKDPLELETIEIVGGESIRLLPTFTLSSAESYQTLRVDIATQETFVDDAFEEISVSWFVTDGSVQDELTWPKFTKSLDTVYTAPPTPNALTNGRERLWMVARDQRGGVSWQEVQILVLAP